MSKKLIDETELFEIYFSRDKKGRNDTKFKEEEKTHILKAVNYTEDTLGKILIFSKTVPNGTIYRVPLIFEKVSKLTFQKNHQNHFAILDYPPIGSMWNKTVKWEGIEIKSRTALISICPMEDKDIFETVAHEIIHAFCNSFLDHDGVNKGNRIYFLEGLTEWITKLASIHYQG